MVTSLEPVPRLGRARSATKWAAGAVLFVVTVLIVGLGIVALLGQTRMPAETWNQWASIGETFGVVNSVFSGVALVAVVLACWVQYQELRMQRHELALQRESMQQSQLELHRSAEASLRMLHFELLRMGIDDPDLAAVWPPLVTNLPHARNRQYLYANLIYQHVFLWMKIGDNPEARMRNELRYLFTSPIMRDYWRAGSTGRASLVEGTLEFRLAQMAEEICRDYDAVAANLPPRAPDATPSRRWEELNNGVAAANP